MTLICAEASMAERITQAELARREGVSRTTVGRWIREGRISPPDATGRLDPEQAHTERLATESPLPKHQAAKAAKARERAENRRQTAPTAASLASATPVPGDATSDAASASSARATASADIDPRTGSPLVDQSANLSAALKLETYKLQKAKAEAANVALDKDAGLLVERTLVEYLLRDLGETIRGELSSFADLHTPTIANARGDTNSVHKQLSDAAHATLERIAEALHRRSEDLLPALAPPRPTQEAPQ